MLTLGKNEKLQLNGSIVPGTLALTQHLTEDPRVELCEQQPSQYKQGKVTSDLIKSLV